jgi:hypothetical protein
MGAERVIAIDRLPERLALARDVQGADVIDYGGSGTGEDGTLEQLRELTMELEEGPRGYELFKTKEDGCLRAVSVP